MKHCHCQGLFLSWVSRPCLLPCLALLGAFSLVAAGGCEGTDDDKGGTADSGSRQDAADLGSQEPEPDLGPAAGDSGARDLASTDGGPYEDAGPGLEELIIHEGCNPLASGWDCLLPFPSDVFMAQDPGMPSGRRVAIPEVALPKDSRGDSVDFNRFHPSDGFSHLPPSSSSWTSERV